MGTPANKEQLDTSGLLDAGARSAGPNDLVIAVEGDDIALDAALSHAQEALTERSVPGDEDALATLQPRALAQTAKGMNLALISVPGPYAAAEALKALRLGLHVFLYSDNVSLEDELTLKQEAERRGLLVMGPDCGTAILAGAPLGFANELRRGSIGLIGASGTGLQQIACLVDIWGGGVSHVLGVGSRDLSEDVGGRSMLVALNALGADPRTDVVVLASKPPAPAVAARVLERAASIGKPTVVCFLGAQLHSVASTVEVVSTLEDAARRALRLAGRGEPRLGIDRDAAGLAAQLGPPRRLLRALYAGGTFAYETEALLAPRIGPLVTHLPRPLRGETSSFPSQHLVLDLGADEFTVGRPHPMIDPSLRIEYIARAVVDPTTAVVLLDVVIGHGAARDPAGAVASALAGLRTPGMPVVIGFVVGTDADPQRRTSQERLLSEAGVVLTQSSTAAALLAGAVLDARKAAE
jgi:FdrA protein